MGIELTIGAILTKIAIGVATNIIVSAVMQALSPAPKQARFDPGTLQDRGRTLNTRQAITPWETVYGEVRKGGPITFEEATRNNQHYQRIVTLASHPCDSVLAHYLGDDVVYPEQLDANGNVTAGKYSGQVRIQVDLGTSGAQPFPDLVTESDGKWTDAHRQEGHTKAWIEFKFDAKVFATGIPVYTARLRGKRYTDTRTAAVTFGVNVSQIINDYFTTANLAGGMGVTAARIDTTVLNNSANIDDELVAVASGQSHDVSAVDIAEDTIDLDQDLAKFVTGDIVEAATTGTLPAGLAAATEYFVDVIRERRSPSAAIRVKLATSLANLRAGSYVDITDAGTGTHTLRKTKEPRYTANGIISSAARPADILDDLRSAFAGHIVAPGAQWSIKTGAYETPTIEFDDDDLVGPIAMQSKISRADRFNAVKGLYVSPLQFDQPDEYPLVSDATAIADDGGIRNVMDLPLPLTNRHSTAQRLATIALQRHRREQTLQVPLNMRGFLVQAGGTCTLSNAKFGYSAQPFEIERLKFETILDGDAPTHRFVLGLRQTDAAVFSYSTAGEITQPPAAPGGPSNPFTVLPVTGLALTSGTAALFTKADGTVVSRLKAAWTASADGLLSGNRVEFKKSSESAYGLHATVPAGQAEAYIFEVEDGVAYDVAVTALGYFGGEAAAAVSANHIIIGKTANPATPANFTITVDADGTRQYNWDVVADADVRAGGGYEIRYFLGSTSDYAAMTALHDGILVASPHESNQLAAGTYTFAVKAVDSSGNVSAPAFISSAAIGDPRIGNVLIARNERTLVWPGLKTDGYVDLGALRATGAQAWSDLPATWSALADTWDTIVTSNSPMGYETAEIDVTGIALDVKFRPLVSVTVIGVATITMQTGTNADGGVTGAFVALASVTARYVKIRISVAGAAPALFELVTLIDSPGKTEDFDDVDTSAASAGLFERIAAGHFRIGTKGGLSVITQAQITALQLVGAGYSWELLSKTAALTAGGALAAEFKIYDSTGTLADATVDVLLRGVRAA